MKTATVNASRTQVEIIRTYTCGSTTGVVYTLNGERAASLMPSHYDRSDALEYVLNKVLKLSYVDMRRGGGKFYAAQIVGPHAQYKMERRFIDIDQSARSITVWFDSDMLIEISDSYGKSYKDGSKQVSREEAIALAAQMTPAAKTTPRRTGRAAARQYKITTATTGYCRVCGCPCSCDLCMDHGGF